MQLWRPRVFFLSLLSGPHPVSESLPQSLAAAQDNPECQAKGNDIHAVFKIKYLNVI